MMNVYSEFTYSTSLLRISRPGHQCKVAPLLKDRHTNVLDLIGSLASRRRVK